MKRIIIFAIICLLGNSWAKNPFPNLSNIKEECDKKFPKNSGDSFIISDQKIFAKCVAEKLGFIKDGILQNDYILERLKNTDEAIPMKYNLRLCQNIAPSDPNDFAFEIGKCLSNYGFNFLENWKSICRECSDKVKLSKDEYLMLQYLPVENITETMKLYAKCALKRYGFLKNNSLQKEVVLEASEDYKDAKHLREYVKICKDIKEDNENDTAFRLFKCMKEIEDKYIQSTEDEYKMIQRVCLKENQLTPNEVFSENPPTKPISTLKIFANCVFDKIGYITQNILQKNVIYEKGQRAKYAEKYLNSMYKCYNNVGFYNYDDDDNCYDCNAYKFGQCLGLFSGEHFLTEWEMENYECKVYNGVVDQNPNMKYYPACVFKKLNFLKDNILQEYVILQAMNDYRDAKYLSIFLNRCRHIKENKHGETALKLYVCMQKIIDKKQLLLTRN